MRASEFITEAKSYQPPEIEVGDEVRVGKFKNRKAEVKGFTTDENNQPVLKTTKGDQQLFKPRISKLMKEDDEPARIKIGGGNTAAKVWIEKVYAKYPQTFQNNHVMPLGGAGEDQQFAMFELTPSFSKRGAVEIKWIQAYPLRQGVGSRAMQELQALAKEDGIALTLFPWDKGQVSQSKLTKFYKGHGFAPTTKGSKSLQWTPSEKQA
jgi:hypothetical protein